MQVADDAHAAAAHRAAQAGHRDEFKQVVVKMPLRASRKERVFVRRFLQRPGRVSREQAERPERDPAARDEMQRIRSSGACVRARNDRYGAGEEQVRQAPPDGTRAVERGVLVTCSITAGQHEVKRS